ncbi:hypothetical protein THIOM_004060 [Candidatus Thiomargarita nelsonii]|uniref:Uncharacterized protein n=1 Tax=Candidatus Thiomargarita nelsonii TaxID=1003181 RepID=A0A176RWX5_9GAMM|nr:hypothetical protein THIOM_004060 [Candidatus Thiomargarita nelsonii]
MLAHFVPTSMPRAPLKIKKFQSPTLAVPAQTSTSFPLYRSISCFNRLHWRCRLKPTMQKKLILSIG